MLLGHLTSHDGRSFLAEPIAVDYGDYRNLLWSPNRGAVCFKYAYLSRRIFHSWYGILPFS